MSRAVVVATALLVAAQVSEALADKALVRPGTMKLMVDASDKDAVSRVVDQGGRLLADRGSYLVFEAPIDKRSSLTAAGVTIRDDFDTILLNRVQIDTRKAVERPTLLSDKSDAPRRLKIVQFAAPPVDADVDLLQAAGCRIVHYIPENSYIVWSPETPAGAKRGDGLDALVASGRAQYASSYFPEYALSPELDWALAPEKAADLVDITVQLYRFETLSPEIRTSDDYLKELNDLAIEVIQQPDEVLHYTNVTLRVPATALPQIAKMDPVVWIEPYTPPTLHSEAQAQVMAGNVVVADGITPIGPGYSTWLTTGSRSFPTTPSSYPVVVVIDDGLDSGTTVRNDMSTRNAAADQTLAEGGNLANPSRIAYIRDSTNAAAAPFGNAIAGHGHLNANIAFGLDTRTGTPSTSTNGTIRGTGINPFGRVASNQIFTDAGGFSVTEGVPAMLRANYAAGARITTNSWGSNPGSGVYNTNSQTYDSITRDASTTLPGNQEMLQIISAGNSGRSGATTIGAPGTGKNVLTVGATEGAEDDGVSDGSGITTANDFRQSADFSSRGPTTDGRIKPDLTAPGTHTTGTGLPPGFGWTGSGVSGQSSRPNPNYYPAGQTIYSWSSGTSHSTPAVAGWSSLVANYLDREYSFGAVGDVDGPSPAMLKAYMLHATRYLNSPAGTPASQVTGGNLPTNTQGYGFPDMDFAFRKGATRTFVDQSRVIGASGEQVAYLGSVTNASEPVRVVLAWTDAPGATSGNAYINNLDLEVTAAGTLYRGNVFSGASSTAGGSADVRNNVEAVFLPSGAGNLGPISIVVRGTSVGGDGIPGNADLTDQDFALIVYNAESVAAAPSIAAETPVTINDTLFSGNGNSVPEPGESNVQITLPFRNASGYGLTNATLTTTSPTPGVTVLSGTSTVGTWADGATATTTVRVTLDASLACGATFELVTTAMATEGPSPPASHTLRASALGSPATLTRSFAGATAIPDGNSAGVNTTVTIPAGTGEVTNVEFSFDGSACSATSGSTTVGLTHNWVGDLVVSLRAPSLTTPVILMNRPGGVNNAGRNFCNTVLRDGGASSIQSITAAGNPWSGVFSAASPLAASFAGLVADGTWTLNVADILTPDAGTLRNWSVVVTARPFVCSPPASCSSSVTVTTGADDGVGSLRNAIRAVCDGGEIVIDDAAVSQIVLTSGELVVDKNVTIRTALGSTVTITRGPSAPSFRLMSTSATGAGVSLSRLYFLDGDDVTGLGGGAIRNTGVLGVADCFFENNTSSGDGGAIWTRTSLAGITRTVFQNNSSMDSGGAIYAMDRTGSVALNLSRSAFFGNDAVNGGGAISSTVNSIIDNVTVDSNHSAAGAGGIEIFSVTGLPNLLIRHATVTRNTTTTGVAAGVDIVRNVDGSGFGNLILQNSIVFGNRAGSAPGVAADLGRGGLTLPILVTSGTNFIGALADSFAPRAEDNIGVDPMIMTPLSGFLPYLGGPVPTIGLRFGSPAKDVAASSAVATDARGVSRPQGPAPDVGAYEASNTTEGDGVPDDVENQVPSAAGSLIGPFGDGNGDDIADSVQPGVASLPLAGGAGYATLSSTNGTLSDLSTSSDPTPGFITPADFERGFVAFRVTLTPGFTTSVVSIFYQNALGAGTTSYFKYGRSSFNPVTPRVYRFDYNSATSLGAQFITTKRIDLYLADGQLGDSDLAVNGVIDDPGGPGIATPLLVDLVSFSAAGNVGGPVMVQWETAAEVGTAGFHVYAGDAATGSPVPGSRLTTDLIPATGGAGGGATYQFLDSRLLGSGEERWYFLQEIETNGVRLFYGPAKATVSNGGATSVTDWQLMN